MGEASAFVPGHLTGFFQICDEAEDPLKKGSRGSGFSISRGIHTRVRVIEAQRSLVRIGINGKVTTTAFVSENVVSKMTSRYGKPCRVEVEHGAEIPIGSGFGASGAGALGLALALNEALSLRLSRIEAARVAHVAEIECRTGLGTVLAGLSGGFGVIAKAGGPGIGETVKFEHDIDLKAVCLHFGPISTRKALSSPELRSRINELGGRYVDELKKEPSAELFLKLSRRFAEHVGLITPRIRGVFEKTDRLGFTCSMAMFGETVFSLVEEEESERLASLLKEAAPSYEVFIDSIDEDGARLLT
ncbi:GHMP kinase [Candidatus Bathyarchaeota archaeon]|nr:GHMP kinase [Candidatus Bathyarchaeota archaeon]